MAENFDYEGNDAAGLAHLIACGEATPTELLEAAFSRIETKDKEIGSVVSTFYEKARAQIDAGLPKGPLSGVPFLLKDLGVEYAGTPFRLGSRLLSDYVSTRTTHMVSRYLSAGLVIAGKVSTSEAGLVGTVETEADGITKNPWDLSLSTGGSSGGSGAAVAARLVPMAHGSDAGGSMRIPASWCGMFGFKPSRGRNSSAPSGEGSAGLTTIHAITRSVRDSALLLDITQGYVPGDPYTAPPPARPYAQEVSAPVGRLRIGLARISEVTPSDNAQKAMRLTCDVLRSLGHQVEEFDLPFSPRSARHLMRLITGGYMGNMLDQHAQRRFGRPLERGDVERQTWETIEQSRTVSASGYIAALNDMHASNRRLAPYFERFDIVLSPTTNDVAQPLGTLRLDADSIDQTHEKLMSCFPYTQIYNQTGQPAMSVPLFWTDEGLPLGSQFSSGYGREDVLFRLAGQLEAACPWAHRRPAR
ncbi:amidase [Ottowia thiooxydans]|uniref:amidase n=1 Tax=Ottowia thiooxydans TaxID=219182 RepID=UPI00048CF87D|nr:amidase [Ottowia thiooxydans]